MVTIKRAGQRARNVLLGAICSSSMLAIEPALQKLHTPTLIVWALDDIYFDVSLAHWLQKTIPGVVRLLQVPAAKLFFPEDRPHELIDPLRELFTQSQATT